MGLKCFVRDGGEDVGSELQLAETRELHQDRQDDVSQGCVSDWPAAPG